MMRQQFLLVCVVAITGCAAQPLPWQHYTEKDFPARVRSITTGLGNVMDTNREVKYGSWTVSLGRGIPYAFYRCSPKRECVITITNLKCQSGDGRVDCQLKLNNADTPACELFVPKRETLGILCPYDVVLERDVITPRGKR